MYVYVFFNDVNICIYIQIIVHIHKPNKNCNHQVPSMH